MTAQPDPSDIENWWVALVTFERRGEHHTEFLPDNCQGAVGWMACHTNDGAILRDLIERALAEVGLPFLEIAAPAPAGSFAFIRRLDSHLAANIATLESWQSVVWGTITTYVGD